jgi:hypothetical protein
MSKQFKTHPTKTRIRVFSLDGQVVLPTTPQRARHLVREKNAVKGADSQGFFIRLTKEVIEKSIPKGEPLAKDPEYERS